MRRGWDRNNMTAACIAIAVLTLAYTAGQVSRVDVGAQAELSATATVQAQILATTRADLAECRARDWAASEAAWMWYERYLDCAGGTPTPRVDSDVRHAQEGSDG